MPGCLPPPTESEKIMRLNEWTVSLPADLFDSPDAFLHYAIDYVREDIAEDYCVPATWGAWLIGDADGDDIEVCVTRLSHGGSTPHIYTGYCYADESLRNLRKAPGETIEICNGGHADYVSTERLDGHLMHIWLCPDGVYRAQLAVYIEGMQAMEDKYV